MSVLHFCYNPARAGKCQRMNWNAFPEFTYKEKEPAEKNRRNQNPNTPPKAETLRSRPPTPPACDAPPPCPGVGEMGIFLAAVSQWRGPRVPLGKCDSSSPVSSRRFNTLPRRQPAAVKAEVTRATLVAGHRLQGALAPLQGKSSRSSDPDHAFPIRCWLRPDVILNGTILAMLVCL
jgi:hypothetical protein